MLEETLVNDPAAAARYGLSHHRRELAEQGWTLLQPGELSTDLYETLAPFGRVIPQFNGLDTFEVTLKPGFDDLPYSQSMNGIGPHTEAPVYDPPPRYLVLHCHRQATCGGGHTQLADGLAFLKTLPADLQAWIEGNPVAFNATAKPGETTRRVLEEYIFKPAADGDIFRFSYNQFHYGDVNPSQEDLSAPEGRNSGTPLGRIAALGEQFFLEHCTPLLIPDGCVLIWDNWRLMHARSQYRDPQRHLTRYWLA
ncbi:TauD/TfdA family dioxygenase [Pseudomonas gingeri]|uniref:TauD/TfdA family dioxygenase n=1 Tax=Pseudomonas gingeri TaxID=117681 RepID=UPI0015A2A38D|nr:TauD/TfdA family dioxygenase [Pseudomonas gingeri]NWA01366.1 TauD/TfdA family dioxygenase [Pseudomonas gingeri]NWA13831.1 TauD/TfdA family dioxygenase [Pseudomonas gingeri]NWA52809.1 TauD/TfdA family dioxygenase [Pseudomonas gingeri]NWA96306.1 TauD/TfdA family dioxygenase [Pseudomonas gingeri]NWB00058.1 TauD/TfdA family dioxygenase [Pseudomonas gingeri]